MYRVEQREYEAVVMEGETEIELDRDGEDLIGWYVSGDGISNDSEVISANGKTILLSDFVIKDNAAAKVTFSRHTLEFTIDVQLTEFKDTLTCRATIGSEGLNRTTSLTKKYG